MPPEMRCWLDSDRPIERGRQIRHQVRRILDADGNPQEPGTDARPRSRRFFHAGMSHAHRMRDETLHSAEGLGESEAFKPRQEGFDRRLASLQLETQHRTKAALLAPRNLMARMIGQTRVVHPPDAGMLAQKLHDRGRVLGMNAHARMQRAHAAQSHEAVERRAGDADCVRPPGKTVL